MKWDNDFISLFKFVWLSCRIFQFSTLLSCSWSLVDVTKASSAQEDQLFITAAKMSSFLQFEISFTLSFLFGSWYDISRSPNHRKIWYCFFFGDILLLETKLFIFVLDADETPLVGLRCPTLQCTNHTHTFKLSSHTITHTSLFMFVHIWQQHLKSWIVDWLIDWLIDYSLGTFFFKISIYPMGFSQTPSYNTFSLHVPIWSFWTSQTTLHLLRQYEVKNVLLETILFITLFN
jgi:hypothetical protein